MRTGWEYKKLGECFPYIKNGANIRQIKDADGLPITRIETLSGGVFNRDRMGYAGITEVSKYKDYVLEDGDLLMSHINSKTYIGRTVEYKKEGEEIVIHGMNLLRLKAYRLFILPSFFAYYTNSSKFKSDVARIRKDAVNQSSMAIGDLKKFDIPLPPIPQQRLIVSELDKINSLIALKREQLKKYDELAQSLFYEMFGDPVENEKGWEVKRITDVCLEISAGGDASKHVIRKAQDETFSIPVYSNGIEREGLYGYSNQATISQPAITLAARGTIGAAFIRKNPYIPIIRLVSVIPDLTKIDLIYLYYILQQTKWDNTGGTIPQLPVPKVKLLNLPLPPLSLQRLFAQRIEQIEEQKKQITASIAKLETLLASRMQYWFE